MAYRRGKSGNSCRFYFLWLPNHADGDCSHGIKRRMLTGKKAMANLVVLVLGFSVVDDPLWPHGCSPPDSSVHGISQARILEWVFIYFSRGSSRPRDWNLISCGYCIGRWILLPVGHQRSPSYQNLGSILESRDTTLLTKICIVKAMVFPVVMYGCESLVIKQTEHQRIDVFKLWCWRRLLRVPCTARRSNQSTPKEINPEYSLEGLLLKLKPKYFGYLVWRVNSLENTPMLGKNEDKRRRGKQGIRWLDSLTDSMSMICPNSGRWWSIEEPGMLHSMGSQRVGYYLVTNQHKIETAVSFVL